MYSVYLNTRISKVHIECCANCFAGEPFPSGSMLGSGRLHDPYGCTVGRRGFREKKKAPLWILDHPYQIVCFETSLLSKRTIFLVNIDDRDLRLTLYFRWLNYFASQTLRCKIDVASQTIMTYTTFSGGGWWLKKTLHTTRFL